MRGDEDLEGVALGRLEEALHVLDRPVVSECALFRSDLHSYFSFRLQVFWRADGELVGLGLGIFPLRDLLPGGANLGDVAGHFVICNFISDGTGTCRRWKFEEVGWVRCAVGRSRVDELVGGHCPYCGGEVTEARQFNLMFKTFVGPVEEDASVAYLRPALSDLLSRLEPLGFSHTELRRGLRQILSEGEHDAHPVDLPSSRFAFTGGDTPDGDTPEAIESPMFRDL